MDQDHQLDDHAGLPPLRLTAPDGCRVTVSVPSAGNTVGELADSLGMSRRSRVLIDGRPVDRRIPLDRADIAHGSQISERSACRVETRGRRAIWPALPTDGVADPVAVDGPSRSVVVVTEAGPAAGSSVVLAPGRHVLGRAGSAAVHLDDDLVELHHAVVDVEDAASVSFTQIAGRVPCRASPAADPDSNVPGTPIGAGTRLARGSMVMVGASRLRIGSDGTRDADVRPAALTPLRGDPWRRTLHRTPRSLPVWDPALIEIPAAANDGSSHAGSMLAAALSVLGGVAVAAVMQNAIFLIFSAVGFFVAFGTRIAGRVSDRKRRKVSASEAKRERERFAEEVSTQRDQRLRYHMAFAPTIESALAAARTIADDVWSRRSAHDDAFIVSLGWGTVSWTARLGQGQLTPDTEAIVERAQRFDDQPVTARLGHGESLAIAGAHAAAIARSLIVQLATLTGPADWRLLVVVDEIDDWDWCGWLPHATSGGRADLGPTVVAADDVATLNDVLGRLDDGDCRHVVLVTDRADLLSTRTGALRRYLGVAPSVGVVAVVRDGRAVPSMCRSLLEVGSLCVARWCPDTGAATTSTVLHAAGVSIDDADAAARRLAPLHDPEDPSEAANAVPSNVSLSRLMKRGGQGAVDDPIAIAACWRTDQNVDGEPRCAADGRPRAVIGLTADGVVEIDLVRDGPHALIAGTTGSGKSELLRTLVVSLAARSSPDELTFVLIDYKGGSTFDACADLPHTVGVVTDLDDRLAERALTSLEAEIRRRERLLRGVTADNLEAYRALRPTSPLPRLVVVIDEFAAMAAELPGFLSALVGVAQRGRSLGIHLILATQRPAGVVSDEIRANTNLRIALRLHDRADAMDIVGDAEPSTFARGRPGRAMMRLGPGETLVFQTAHSSGPHQPVGDGGLQVMSSHRTKPAADVAGRAEPADRRSTAAPTNATELVVLTRSVRAAASLCEIAPPYRPWLEPLGALLGQADLVAVGREHGEGGIVGLVDDPAGQRRLPLVWRRRDGNLALVGSFGSGTTTTLKSILVAAGGGQHVYVIDARGDGRLDELERLSWCGGVIGIHEAERRSRLVQMLIGEIGRRQSSALTEQTPIVLAIDGLSALIAALSGPREMDEHARLGRILADGVTVGIHTIATFERAGGVPASVLAAFGQRWLFHLDDPLDAGTLGVKPAMTPPAVAGRIVVVGQKLEAQVALLPVPERNGEPDGRAPSAIASLPDDVDATTLGTPPTAAADGATTLLVGLDFATLSPATLDVPDGEHVIVLGPAGSGRSTALIRTVAAWRAVHPGGNVIAHCPKHSSPVAAWVATAVPHAMIADDETSLMAALEEEVDRADCRMLVVVDDAERVDDADGSLLSLVSARHAHVTVVAAGRPDTLRLMYGHWTAVVRRSRIGLIMTKGSETDGELLGEPLPRRLPIAARPGLAWLVDGSGCSLIQTARDVIPSA